MLGKKVHHIVDAYREYKLGKFAPPTTIPEFDNGVLVIAPMPADLPESVDSFCDAVDAVNEWRTDGEFELVLASF